MPPAPRTSRIETFLGKGLTGSFGRGALAKRARSAEYAFLTKRLILLIESVANCAAADSLSWQLQLLINLVADRAAADYVNR